MHSMQYVMYAMRQISRRLYACMESRAAWTWNISFTYVHAYLHWSCVQGIALVNMDRAS